MSGGNFFGPLRDLLDTSKSKLAEEQAAIHRIGLAVGSAASLEEVGDALADQVRALVPFDRLCIWTGDLEKGTFAAAYVSGIEAPGRGRGDELPLGSTVAGEAIRSGEPLMVADESPEVSLARFPGMRPALEAGIRSVIAVPLLSDDVVVAAMTLASDSAQAYSEPQLATARMIGRPVGLAVARCAGVEALKHHASENAALAEIGRISGASAGTTHGYDLLAGRIHVLVPYDRLEVTAIDNEAGTGTDVYVGGDQEPGWEAGRSFELLGTIAETVRDSGSGIVTGPSQAPGAPTGYESEMVVPLVSDDLVVAILTFRSIEPGAYSGRHLSLAERIAAQLVAAVAGSAAKSRLQERLRQAGRLEDALSEIDHLMWSSPDADSALESASQAARSLVPFDRVLAARLDPEGHRATVTHVAGAPVPGWDVGASFQVDSAQYVALVGEDAGVVEAAESAAEVASRIPGWPFIAEGGIRSVLAVPLRSMGQVHGILVMSSSAPGAFHREHLTVANRIATIVSAHLAVPPETESRPADEAEAQEAQEAEGRARARAQGDLMDEIAGLMASAASLSETYDLLLDRLRSLIPFSVLSIAAAEDDGAALAVLYEWSEEGEDGDGALSGPVLWKAMEEAARERAPSLLHGTPPGGDEEAAPVAPAGIGRGERSVLGIPLVSRGRVVGALGFASLGPEPFSDDDLAATQGVAIHVAASVAAERVERERAGERRELDALAEIGRIVASEERARVYRLFDEQLRVLLPAEFIEIDTVGPLEGAVTPVYRSGPESAGVEPGAPLPLADTVYEECLRLRAPVLHQAETSDDLSSQFPSASPGQVAGIRSLIALPLLVAGEVVGAMSIGSTEPGAFAPRDVSLAEEAGNRVGALLAESATETGPQADSDEMGALAEIGRIATSSVDMYEVFDTLAERVRDLVRFERMAIWTVDLLQENLVAAYVTGAGAPGFERGKSIPLTSPAAREALSTRSGAAVPEDADAALAGKLQGLLGGSGPRMPAVIFIPLVLGNESVGMLSLRASAQQPFSKRDVAVAERVAAQIAGPVANAQVYVECRQVEEGVRNAVQRLDLAISGSGDGLWDWDFSKNAVWHSPRYKQLVGLDEAEEEGLRDWNDRLHQDDRERVHEAQNEHLEEGAPYDVEYRLRTGSGGYRWFNDRGRATWDDTGKATRFSGSLRDIHDAKSAEIGPPDLRAPLATIEGFRQALLRRRDMEQDSERRDYVAALESASMRATQLSQDLMTLTAALTGKMRSRPVNLSGVAWSVATGLRKRYPRRRVKFTYDRGVSAKGDPQLLRTVLTNLLDNAWKHTAGRRKPSVGFGAIKRDGEVVYYVRDSGAGFDQSQAGGLFTLFGSAHPEAVREGTGVGLATVAHIVRRHGGRVWAEGRARRGATFYFTLWDGPSGRQSG